jgi:branched-subunit amino acid permease
LTFGILFNFTKNLDPKLSFAITAVVVAILGVVILAIVKEPNLKHLHKGRTKIM